MKDLERSVRDLVGSTDATTLSNVIMRVPDKVCAAAFAILSDDARARLYAVIGDTKAHRIREEIRIETRRRTSAAVRAGLVRVFLAYFRHRATAAPRIWIRPMRRRRP
ncbi:MAG TPA: hypothetical protein VL354_16795 [Spirochaetia bacterium]|nr:hypothetical protein [Spirochaetia bacterium]